MKKKETYECCRTDNRTIVPLERTEQVDREITGFDHDWICFWRRSRAILSQRLPSDEVR